MLWNLNSIMEFNSALMAIKNEITTASKWVRVCMLSCFSRVWLSRVVAGQATTVGDSPDKNTGVGCQALFHEMSRQHEKETDGIYIKEEIRSRDKNNKREGIRSREQKMKAHFGNGSFF